MPIGKGYFGLAKETTFGTAVAPQAHIPILSLETSTDPQNYYPEAIKNTRAKSQGIPMGLLHEGTLEMDAEPRSLGYLLLGALGTVNSTQPDDAGAPSVYEHAFTPGDVLPSYTIEKYDTTMTERAAGCKFDTLTLSVEAGSEGTLKASGEFRAQSLEDQSSPGDPSYNDAVPFTFNKVTVSKGGNTNDNVRTMEVEISNNLKDDHFVLSQSRSVSDITEGMREVTFSVEMYFKDKQDYLDFLSGSSDSLSFVFDGATLEGTFSEKLDISLPNVLYDSFEAPMGGADDDIIATLEGTAIYDDANGYEIKATLTNDETSY